MVVSNCTVGVNAQSSLARLRDNLDACEIESVIGIAVVCRKVDRLWGAGLNYSRIILGDRWIVARGNRNRHGRQTGRASRNIANAVGETVDRRI